MKFYHNYSTFLTGIALFILLTILCVSNSFGIWIEPYLKKVDTKDVRSIKITEYSFTRGNWQEVDVMMAEYNNAGSLIKEARYTADGILQFEYYYSYNDKGEMIKVTGHRMRNEALVPYEYEYMYDQRGNQIKGIGYGANGTETSIYTARYDENDSFVEGIKYKDGMAISKYIAEYEAGNNLIEESKYKVYRYKGTERYQLEYRHLYSYDSKNNLITEKNYGNDGALECHYSYQYDEDNNLVEGISYAKDGSVLSRYSAEYDNNNNLVKSIHYGPDGNITSEHIARYDKNNHLIEESNCTESSNKIIYRAEYDEAGNLLEETHYSEYVIGSTGLDYRYRYKYDSRNNRIEEIYYVYFQEENNWKPISRQINEIYYQK